MCKQKKTVIIKNVEREKKVLYEKQQKHKNGQIKKRGDKQIDFKVTHIDDRGLGLTK